MELRWGVAQYFELKWWKRYLHKKEKQSYLQKKTAYWQHVYSLCSDTAPCKSTDHILDMGCGPAGIFILFKNNPVTAVDPLLDAYTNDLGFLEPANYPNVNFICAPVEAFAPKEAFDLVFCLNVINHVKDIEQGFTSIVNSTKSGGKTLVSIDAHNHKLLRFIFRLIPGDILHPHQYSLDEYADFLRRRGCKILKTVLIKRAFIFNHYILIAGK